MPGFSKRISFAVKRELAMARRCKQAQLYKEEFHHLENAHVLGQQATYWHTRVHITMLVWAIENRDYREFFGQLMRIVGAMTKTAFGWVPKGNTGGANVSPFASMPLQKTHARKIDEALRNARR